MFWKYTSRFISMKVSLQLNLFNALVTPILLYCAEIWFPCLSQSDINRIEIFFTKNLKKILGVPECTANAAVYFELRQKSIAAIMRENILEFICKLKDDPTNWLLLQHLFTIDCSWVNYCNSVLALCELNLVNLNPLVIPHADLDAFFVDDLLLKISLMFSLKFLHTCKFDDGFVFHMDCIPNRK